MTPLSRVKARPGLCVLQLDAAARREGAFVWEVLLVAAGQRTVAVGSGLW